MNEDQFLRQQQQRQHGDRNDDDDGNNIWNLLQLNFTMFFPENNLSLEVLKYGL